ncbi:MAG: tyrosine-type recombinase/integrase [Phycisphaeraceae bacterium]|nr:tyrosine-type recombinase/integrase [Phycisphaeraceae bacterium]
MPHLYRKLRFRPLPAGAVPKSLRGVAGFQWTDGRGREQWAPAHADGKRIVIEDSKWTVQYSDASGKRRETGSGTSDEKTAREVAASIEMRVARERRGIDDPTEDRYAKFAREPIEEHLRGYIDWLADEGDSGEHVGRTRRMIDRALAAAKISTAGDLDSARLAKAIRGFRTTRGGESGRAGGKPKPISNATYNAHVRAVKAFSRWLYTRKRAREDALRDMSFADAAVGRTLYRREVTAADLAKIIAQAEKTDGDSLDDVNGKGKKRFTAPGRAWAYRIAAGTGFRAGEIASLTRESFDLGAKPPTITVGAGYSKRRRRDVQPISRELADTLRPWLATMPHKGRLFRGASRWGAAIKADAKAAGVPVVNPQGTLDFHALRHTYASRIAAITDAKTGQSLTRHASAQLYLSVYAKERDESRAKAVEALSAV